MAKLRDLPNIGPEVERQLHLVGIDTKEKLEDLGSCEAWLLIQAIDSSACIHRLMALEGAIQGIPKSKLAPEDKQYLKDFYQKHKL